MEPETNQDRTAALRPLHAVAESRVALRRGTLDEVETRRAVLLLVDAVEGVLRRMLRDDPAVPVSVRLRALAADEMRVDEVLAELRQRDLLSLELAADVHELLDLRRRSEQGGSLGAAEASLSTRVADRLEFELTRPSPSSAGDQPFHPEEATLAYADEGEYADQLEPPPSSRRWLWLGGGGVAVLLLLIALVRLMGGNDSAQMERGIALFRSGAYADAAAYFWRYAEQHPDDATPHLFLARIHRRMGRLQLAATEIDKAVKIAPDDADVQGELGFLLLETGRADVAVERFRAALELDPESRTSWVGLVLALRAAGRPEAAESVLSQAPKEVQERFGQSGAVSSESRP